MNNKEETRLAHNAIAQQYYDAYKDDQSDLTFFDDFLALCDKNILDLGCGMGHYSNYMKNKGFNVTGIDFSSSMISLAKTFSSDIEFIEHDVCDLSVIKDRKFDGIVIAYVLQHLSKEEVLKLFDDLTNHTNKNSKMLLFLRQGNSVVIEQEPMNPKYKYVINEYSKEEISNLLTLHGWKILKLEDKTPVDDPNSLAPDTLVVIAERNA